MTDCNWSYLHQDDKTGWNTTEIVSFENSWIASARTTQSRGKQSWWRGRVNLIGTLRNELIFHFISFRVPRGRRHLAYSGAVHLPGIDCPSHLCVILSLLPHLKHFSLDWYFHVGVAAGKWEELNVKFHQLGNSLAISRSAKVWARAFGARWWEMKAGGLDLCSFLNYETHARQSSVSMPWILCHPQGATCNSSPFLPFTNARKSIEQRDGHYANIITEEPSLYPNFIF